MLTRSSCHGDRGIEYSIIDFASTARDAHEVQRHIASWLNSDEMADLLALFGRSLTASTVGKRLAEADEISRDIFDFRRGGERWEATKREFSPHTAEAVSGLIGRIYYNPQNLPMIELGEPTHGLVLGGTLNSCLLRAELLGDLLKQGLRPGHIWGLGSRRTAVDMEHEVATKLCIGPVTDELDAMCAALSYALCLPATTAKDHGRSLSEVRQLAVSPIPVTGLAAQAGRGSVRATTSDTYRFFLETAKPITEDDRILIITSAIHAPFQHAQALAELSLPTGATIISVGAHARTGKQALIRGEWTTAEWLQEIRSAIWSMRVMYDKLVSAYPGLGDTEAC